jgi:hypothetical protein
MFKEFEGLINHAFTAAQNPEDLAKAQYGMEVCNV